MGSAERSKKKAQLWKKAIFHFSLCFIMGFFTGFAPTAKSSIFVSHVVVPNTTELSPQPIEMLHQSGNLNISLTAETPAAAPTTSFKASDRAKLLEKEEENEENEEPKLIPRRSVIVVTPIMSSDDGYRGVFLRRLANTMRLVDPPILWIVVEGKSKSNEVREILRKSGIMYRHLVVKENFTDPEDEMEHQKNVALRHIEQHRLSGIVHFASLSNVYDLGFWDVLRDIQVFGTWPMALLYANKKKVIMEGPVCDSSEVIGWHAHLNKMKNETDKTPSNPNIHISSFAFNSSILWDPEIWGRPSLQPTSQNSIKFVKQVVLQDETKLKGMPPQDCSKIMLWQLQFPTSQFPATAFDATYYWEIDHRVQ